MATTPSPLDHLVNTFLLFVAQERPGFSPSARARVLHCAESMGVPPELVEALFVSARSRGFLQPVPHGRVRMRWQVSAAGEAFLAEQRSATPDLSLAAGARHE